MVCYLSYSVLQESVLSIARDDDVHLGWFLTVSQFFIYSVVMLLVRFFHGSGVQQARINPAKRHKHFASTFEATAPLAKYARLGLLSVGTIGLANQACEYLNMPVAQVLKSSKVIPVMLMGRLILGRTYTAAHYFAVLLISVGLSVFIVADTHVQPKLSIVGLVLMLGSLVADALIGNFQEQLFKEHPSMSTSESMMWTKLFGFLGSSIVCLASGSFFQVFYWVVYRHHSRNILIRIVGFGIVGVVGENFIMALVKRFGAVATVTTTTVRKGFSLFLSFLLFPKPFNMGYVLGALIMLSGIIMNIALKNKEMTAKIWHFICLKLNRHGTGVDYTASKPEPLLIV